MKVREVLRLLREDGWVYLTTRGSHRQFKHPTKPGKVTVAGKPSDEMAPGTLGSVLRQAGIDNDEGKEVDQWPRGASSTNARGPAGAPMCRPFPAWPSRLPLAPKL